MRPNGFGSEGVLFPVSFVEAKRGRYSATNRPGKLEFLELRTTAIDPHPVDQQPPAQVKPPRGMDGAGAEDKPVLLPPLQADPPPI